MIGGYASSCLAIPSDCGSAPLTGNMLFTLTAVTDQKLSSASVSGSDFVEVLAVPRHFNFLIEAGLLRIRRMGNWRIFAPNRLLVRIFQRYVRWYTWESISVLRSCIESSSAMHTLKGKTFEYLFALELCEWANGKLWTFLRENTELVPLESCDPNICLISDVNECRDPNRIYGMQDPDQSNSKSDVIFFATDTATEKAVRVLVQLTLADCGPKTIFDSFNVMLLLQPMIAGGQDMLDYRLFFGPKCKYIPVSDNANQDNYIVNRCQAFTSCRELQNAFGFSIDIICNPLATDAAIKQLIYKSEEMG